MKKFTKAFSKIAIILIILGLLLVGGIVGGYFYFKQVPSVSINQQKNSNNLIPEGLQDYAKGQNADAFLIVKNSPETQDLLDKYLPMDPAIHWKGALGLVSKTDGSAILVMSFASAQEAQNVKITFEEANKDSFIKLIPYKIDQKDKVLMTSFGKGLEAFDGSLLDNPHLKSIDPTLTDSEFLLFADNSQLIEVNQILYGIVNTVVGGMAQNEVPETIPAATNNGGGLISASDTPTRIMEATGGQGSPRQLMLSSINALLNFVKNTTLTISLKDEKFKFKTVVVVMDRSEIANSALMQMAKKMSPEQANSQELEKAYDTSVNMLNTQIPELQKALAETTAKINGAQSTVSFSNKILNFEISMPLSTIENQLKQAKENSEKAPERSRDTKRKADLNNLTAAVETYNADKGNYPQKSSCTNELQELKPYFSNNQIPGSEDIGLVLNEEQKFGKTTCPSGYYYQAYGSKGYVLWAKMEDESDGNTSEDPEKFSQDIQTGILPPKEEKGAYYVINEANPQTNSPSVFPTSSQQTKKIPRIKTQ